MTARVLVLPHGDPTLTLAADEVADVDQAFVTRLCAPSRLLAQAARLAGERAQDTAEVLYAAADILSRDVPCHSRLRAASVALRACTERSAAPLTLDDLRLRQGSTASSADLLQARDLPFAEDVADALASADDGRTTELVVERDQRLPALMAACSARRAGTLRVAGEFARRRSGVLSAVLGLRAGQFSDRKLDWRVGGVFTPARSEPLRWVPQFAPLPAVPGPWAGYLDPEALCAAPDLAASSGCVAAVIPVCSIDDEVRTATGARLPADAVAEAVTVMREGGAAAYAEILVGAPAISEDGAKRAVGEAGGRGSPFDGVFGLRPFTMHPEHTGGWRAAGVRIEAPAAAHDLAWQVPFSAPGTIERTRLGEVMAALLAEHAGLVMSPGRLAAGAVYWPDRADAGPLRLDPDTAAVKCGGPEPYRLINLRTRRSWSTPPEMYRLLRRCRTAEGTRAAVASLVRVNRDSVITRLIAQGVLTGRSL